MFPMHRSYELQGSLKRRRKHPHPTSINGYHTAKKLLSQSPAKRPTFTFVHESGYTLGFQRKIARKGTRAETGGDYRSTILTAYSLCSLPALQLRDQKAHLPRTVRAGAKEKANQKGNSLTHNGCAFAAHVRCMQAPRARRHAQPRCFFSLHRGTPRFCVPMITEYREKHTSFYAPSCSANFACTFRRSVVRSNAWNCCS